MATIKFSDFTNQAVDVTNTRVVGFKVGDTSANYKYSIAQLATALSPSINTFYTGDGTIGTTRVATITDTPKFQGTESTNIGLEIDNQYNLSMDPASGGSKLLLSSGTSGITTLELRANRTGNGGSHSSQASINSSGSLVFAATNTIGSYNYQFGTGSTASLTYDGSNSGSILRINSNGGGTPNRIDLGWNSIQSAYIGSNNGVLALGHNIGGVLTECLNYNIAGDLTLDSGTGVMAFKDDGVTLATIATLRTESFIMAASDEDTALAVGTAKAVFRLPYAFTVTSVRASLKTAGTTSGVTTIDINQDITAGAATPTSILSTPITIDYGEFTSTTAAALPVLTTPGALPIADDAQITVDIDGLSGGASETGLKVTLIGYQTV